MYANPAGVCTTGILLFASSKGDYSTRSCGVNCRVPEAPGSEKCPCVMGRRVQDLQSGSLSPGAHWLGRRKTPCRHLATEPAGGPCPDRVGPWQQLRFQSRPGCMCECTWVGVVLGIPCFSRTNDRASQAFSSGGHRHLLPLAAGAPRPWVQKRMP